MKMRALTLLVLSALISYSFSPRANAQVYDACCACEDLYGVCVVSSTGKSSCAVSENPTRKRMCYTIDSFGAMVVDCVKNENWIYNSATKKYQIGGCTKELAGVRCKIRDCGDEVSGRGIMCTTSGICAHGEDSSGPGGY